jgi:hypothetical protein
MRKRETRQSPTPTGTMRTRVDARQDAPHALLRDRSARRIVQRVRGVRGCFEHLEVDRPASDRGADGGVHLGSAPRSRGAGSRTRRGAPRS